MAHTRTTNQAEPGHTCCCRPSTVDESTKRRLPIALPVCEYCARNSILYAPPASSFDRGPGYRIDFRCRISSSVAQVTESIILYG